MQKKAGPNEWPGLNGGGGGAANLIFQPGLDYSFIWDYGAIRTLSRWRAFMKEREKDIYAAGLIDGEGTITLTRLHKNAMRAPVVSFSSTSFELISYFRDNYGGTIITKKVYSQSHTPSWEWRLTYNKALAFIERINPYILHNEKVHRARMLTNEYKSVTPRNGKYTDRTVQLRNEFEHRFFHPSTPVPKQPEVPMSL